MGQKCIDRDRGQALARARGCWRGGGTARSIGANGMENAVSPPVLNRTFHRLDREETTMYRTRIVTSTALLAAAGISSG